MNNLEVNITEEIENLGSDDEAIDDILANQKACVKLKQGLEISKLCSEEGVEFEVDEDDLKERYTDDNYFDEDSMKYTKCELLGGSSSSDEDENDTDTKFFRTPFEKLAAKMVDITPDATGGILKLVLTTGEGKIVPDHASVRVHYNGYLEFTAEPFDSTYLRGHKLIFRLNSGRVIDGLDKGIQTMRKGEKAYFLIQPEYAFGPMGCPPRIPQNAAVLFEVELFSFIDDVALVEFAAMTTEEQSDASFSKLLKVCQADQQSGNEYFKQGHMEKANIRYEHGAKLLEMAILKNEDEQRACEQLQVKLYLNLSLVNDRMGNARRSCRYARFALRLDTHNTKALYRLGHALISMGEYENAKELLLRAKQKEPHNKDILNELIKLDKKVKEYRNTERALCCRMFSNPTNTNDNSVSTNKIPTEEINLTEEFKEFAYDQLKMFKEDETQTEMILPEGLVPGEHTFIAATAKVLNLGLVQEFHSGVLRLKVFKKPK